MKLKIDDLGVVGIIVDDWSFEKSFKPKTIVTDYRNWRTYISRKAVPKHIELTNTYYWKPILKPFGGGSGDAFTRIKVGNNTLVAVGEDEFELIAGENVTIEADTESKTITINAEGKEQVQSDWNESNTQSKAYIKNKPIIPTVPTKVSAFTNDVGYLTQHQDISGKADKSDTYTKEEVYNKREVYNKSETYRKIDVYSRDEVNSIVSRTPDTDVLVLAVPEGSTALDVLNELPNTTDPETGKNWRDNKLFRLRNDANTSFDEYGWTGEAWELLASKDYGIDKHPVLGSTNMLESGGLADIIESTDNNIVHNLGIKYALVDGDGNAISYIDNENNMNMLLNVEAKTINGIEAARTVESDWYKIAFVDKENNLLVGVDKDDNLFSGVWDLSSIKKKSEVTDDGVQDIYDRNIEKDAILTNDAYFTNAGGKRFQILIVADTHLNNDSFSNWMVAGTKFKSLDCCIHLGDMCNKQGVGRNNDEFLNQAISKFSKPSYIAIGNHDVGTDGFLVQYLMDDETMYNQYVLPLINKRYIKSSEYISGKCYYYHDFEDSKVRLIVLYPYETGDVLYEEYWRPIQYDSSYPTPPRTGNITRGQRISVSGYTKRSFEAVKDFTMSGTDYYYMWPRYKAYKYRAWYSQEQLEWLCNTLDSAGELGYTTIIACHYNVLGTANQDYAQHTCRFSNPYRNSTDSLSRVSIGTIISDIVHAYQNEGSINVDVYPVPLNENDIVNSIPSVYFNYSFSHSGDVIFIAGHSHTDSINKSIKPDYNQIGIVFLSGVVENKATKDIIRAEYDDKNMDALTALTLDSDNKQIHLTRIGADVTRRVGEDNRLIKKDNEVINYDE